MTLDENLCSDLPMKALQFFTINRAESFSSFFVALRRLFFLNVFYLFLMSAFRFVSLWVYGTSTQWTSLVWEDLFKVFLTGARYDAVVLGYLAIIPSILLITSLHAHSGGLFELSLRWIQRYYTLMFSLVALLLAADFGYYSYFQDHFNILIFGLIEDDTGALLRTFWKNYPIVWIAIATTTALGSLWRFHLRVFSPGKILQSFERIHWAAIPLTSLTLMTCVFFTARGSFGQYPIGPADSRISQDHFLNYLSSNGVHALFGAVQLRLQSNSNWNNNLRSFGYDSPRAAFADFYSRPIDQIPEDPLILFRQKTPVNHWAEKTRPHVVVLMMESFGAHYLQYQSPAFNLLGSLEAHFEQDLVLKNFLPSTNSTTGSLSSLMISAPQRPIGNFLTDPEYARVPFRSSPARVFARAGYQTRFVYGGNSSWRDINRFAKVQGFDFVDGDMEMEKKLGAFREKHDWGVYDEDVFRYVHTLLTEATQPQMILVMTTTNHPPYQIPSSFQPPEQTIPPELIGRLVGDRQIIRDRFRSYYYSNDTLGKFISNLKASPLAEKTILAATGDHGFLMIHFTDQEHLQKWSVPFYLYTPAEIKPNVSRETFASHMDIFPTLYNLALSETEFDALGVNILDPLAPHYAFHSSGLVVGPSGGAILMGKSENSYFRWQGAPGHPYDQLIPGSEDAGVKTMAIRYKSLMSLLDYYFMAEQTKGNETPLTRNR